MAPAPILLARRLRAPRDGDPTRVQVVAALVSGLFTGFTVTVAALATAADDAAKAGALAGALSLAVGGILLARATPGWRRAVCRALTRERRALRQARATPGQQRRTQSRWLMATGAVAVAVAAPCTLVVAALAATRVSSLVGAVPGFLLTVGVATLAGAAVPGVAAWGNVRRGVAPDW